MTAKGSSANSEELFRKRIQARIWTAIGFNMAVWGILVWVSNAPANIVGPFLLGIAGLQFLAVAILRRDINSALRIREIEQGVGESGK